MCFLKHTFCLIIFFFLKPTLKHNIEIAGQTHTCNEKNVCFFIFYLFIVQLRDNLL
jgi:hypothetical protein